MGQAVRTREPEPEPGLDFSAEGHKFLFALRERSFQNAVVLKGEEVPWQQARQGRLKFFIHRETDRTNTVLRDWDVFLQDIRTHSGAHRHQGGLGIYVVEGEGWTIADGEQVDWEAGDLLLLPIKPNGVVHQHYNRRPGERCIWMAFIYTPYMDELGKIVDQKSASPEYQQRA
ncbi:MAG: cupin domain-containing protein [Dehalococcoidia bacterium]|nr:cupin domain-containing protein [Dehalococcoidia bacterium]